MEQNETFQSDGTIIFDVNVQSYTRRNILTVNF